MHTCAYVHFAPPSAPSRAGTVPSFRRACREDQLRFSSEVARVGLFVIEHHAGRLPDDEKWLVHEQVAIGEHRPAPPHAAPAPGRPPVASPPPPPDTPAAPPRLAACLDVRRTGEAEGVIKAMMKGLPDGGRLSRVRAMWVERSNPDDVDAVYDTQAGAFPTNLALMQRRVGKDLSRAGAASAANALLAYLRDFGSDADAWESLAGVYLGEGRHPQALYCLEECMLHAPGSATFVLRYADLLYTLDRPEAFALAGKYYARAVQMTAGRLPRALFGAVAALSRAGDAAPLAHAQRELAGLSARALREAYPAGTAEGNAVGVLLERCGVGAGAP